MNLWHLISYPFRRDRRRPLSQRQPGRDTQSETPLGFEAIDMSVVDAVNRRNSSLERASTFFTSHRRYGSFAEKAETHIAPLTDDETYAARYHSAYNQKKGR